MSSEQTTRLARAWAFQLDVIVQGPSQKLIKVTSF